MSTAYKTNEKILSTIIKNNVKIINSHNILKFRIYYRNRKTSNLIIKNNNASTSYILLNVHMVTVGTITPNVSE